MACIEKVRRVLAATGQDFEIEVEGASGRVITGRVVGVANTHKPMLGEREGGSNLIVRFADGTEVPVERIKEIRGPA
jgi:hypothetical protein